MEALNRVIDDKVANLRLTSAKLLTALNEKNRTATRENTSIDWDIDVGGGGAAWESVTQDGQDTSTDDVVPAQLRIGSYRVKHQFKVSKVAITEAASRAPEELKDLFGAHVTRGLTHITREVNRALYLADGTAAFGQMVGLNSVINNTSSYAGINPTTYTSWKSIVLGNGTARNLTKDLLLDLDEAVANNETMYDAIVMSPTTAKAYNKLFDLQGANNTPIILTSDGRFPEVDLGHGARYYNGYPIIEDPLCPNGIIYFMNSADITLFTFKMRSGSAKPSQYEEVVTNNVYGLNLHISELPSNNSAVRKFELFVLPQLRVFSRKSVMVIKDLN